MSAIHIYDMNRWLKQSEIACAMSLEALFANLKPYDVRLHQVRGFKGAIRSAQAIMKCIKGSDLQTGKLKSKVQDGGPGAGFGAEAPASPWFRRFRRAD